MKFRFRSHSLARYSSPSEGVSLYSSPSGARERLRMPASIRSRSNSARVAVTAAPSGGSEMKTCTRLVCGVVGNSAKLYVLSELPLSSGAGSRNPGRRASVPHPYRHFTACPAPSSRRRKCEITLTGRYSVKPTASFLLQDCLHCCESDGVAPTYNRFSRPLVCPVLCSSKSYCTSNFIPRTLVQESQWYVVTQALVTVGLIATALVHRYSYYSCWTSFILP